jgi:ferritin-like metal-binding protein YciE
MTRAQRKIVQYLEEAHAMELGLVRALEAHTAMAPPGSYRVGLERHLGETREHAVRVQTRLSQLGSWGDPLRAGLGLLERVVAQALALGTAPLDLVRGASPEEKVLKSARDTCAAEAREIATYTALERLARGLGDDETALLASSILVEEQRMLERVLVEIPKLTEAVVRAELRGEPSYALAESVVNHGSGAGLEGWAGERAVA